MIYLFKKLLPIIVVAIAVYVGGRLGQLLAVPPGYASPFWPPAGVGIAALLLWGRRMLPGIFLGSCGLNIWIGLNVAGGVGLAVSFAAVGIALGSTIQAIFAVWLIGKYMRQDWMSLSSFFSIVHFFFLIGPLASLVAATFGVCGLVLSGFIPLSDAIYSWVHWWLGDCLGAITVTPLVICLFSEQSLNLWRSRRYTYAIPLILVLGVLMLAFSAVFHQEQRQLQLIFDNQSSPIEKHIEVEVANIADAVRTTAAYFDSSARVEYDEFVKFANNTRQIHPQIVALSWAPLVKSDQINHFENDAKRSGLAEFRVREKDVTGVMLPVRTRDVYFPVLYIDPMKGNEKALGYDLFSESKRRQVLEKSRSTGQFTISEKIQLVQNAESGTSLLAVVPVFEAGKNSNSINGFVTGIVQVEPIIKSAISNLDIDNLAISLQDLNVLGESGKLYASGFTTSILNIHIKERIKHISVGGRTWVVKVSPTAQYISIHTSWLPWLTLTGGLSLTFLLSVLILTVTGHSSRFEQEVLIRTQELSASESKLRAIIDASPVPFALNDEMQRITYLNPSFTKTFGYSLNDIPTLAHWWSLAHPDPVYRQWVIQSWQANLLAAKLTNFEFAPIEVLIHCKDGFVKTVIATATSLSENFMGNHLVSLFDITERKKNEEELRLAYAVYQNSSEAMIVCDADNHMIAVNPAFTDMTGYSAEEVIGRNPKILSSGRQSKEFYKDMWHIVNTIGHWQGEIWNRKKCGEEFAEFLTINTMYNDDGSVHRRIALFSDITEKKKSDTLIWTHANYDSLTNLPNRRLFVDRLEREIVKSHRDNSQFALLFIDLDQFKDVNDTLGHHMGDELLIQASKRIEHCIRETDTLARLGGDEFTAILSELKNSSDIGSVAQSILDTLAEPFLIGEEYVFISASIGITVYPDDGNSAPVLLQNADQAMYSAKQQGRNCFSFFTSSLQKTAITRMHLGRDLRLALVENQLEVYFQPIVDFDTGNIYKAEALLRWKHPERGYVSPATFIPIAEETGVICDIGDWVFRQAVHELVRLKALTGVDFQISINKSPAQFRARSSVHRHWGEYLSLHELPKNSLIVEITEGLLLNAEQKIHDQLCYLRDLGMQIAIDDFGTGYSALSYLQKFDIDYLKIDQSFTRNLESNSESVALCEAIIIMAHKLKLKVIAEGIETKQQRDLLISMGCDYGQGYLFSRPVPAGKFEQLLLNAKSA